MAIYILQQVVFVWVLQCYNAIGNTLQMVHLVYRHGARSPLFAYPSDRYQLKDWHGGPGQLTQLGMKQEYDLGNFLRSRYAVNHSFIGPPYHHTEVYIESSDVDRCLESAQVQLAGLYPPEDYQVWNKDLPWQPVPIHSTDKNADPVLRSANDYCPKRDELFSKKKTEPVYRDKISHSQMLLSSLSNYTGMQVNFDNLFHITDVIISERTQGWAQPKWVNDLWDKLINLSDWIFLNNYSGSDELGRILGGPLLQKIHDNMEYFIDDKRNKHVPPKINIFSAHDTTLLSLAAGLDISISRPSFSSCIMIELYSSQDGMYIVEIYFRNDHTNNVHPLKLKNCEFSCPLDEFLKLTRNRVSANRNIECGIRTPPHVDHSIFHLKMWVLTFFVICLLFSIVLLVMFCRQRSNRKKKYYEDEVDETEEQEHLI